MILNLLLYGILIVVTCYDVKYRKIPDKLIIALFLLGFISMICCSVPGTRDRLIGFFAVPLLLVICNFFRKGSFGGGDIKLLAGCGWFLGWRIAIVGLVISIICCAIYCTMGILLSRINKKTILAFGPFICLGMIIASCYGENLIVWYLR